MNNEFENNNEDKTESVNGDTAVKPKFADTILDWIESFFFAVFVVILIFTFILRTVVVVGDSMNPNFEGARPYSEDYSGADRLIITHLISPPEKGDVLVMNCHGLNETIIKRCIGTEGDNVKIDYNKNKVYVNGKEISNDYINESMEDKYSFDQSYKTGEGIYEYKVPEDKVFVMGDNRNHSSDSRDASVGFIDEDDILGTVIFRIYPFDKVGKIGNML